MYHNLTIGVAIPAFNEENNIGTIVTCLKQLSDNNKKLIDKIVVCDNVSTDKTASVATDSGALVVYESYKGYGAACLQAIKHLDDVDIIVFVDADQSVVLEEITRLLKHFEKMEVDLVVGSRLVDKKLASNVMSLPQRFGNQLASWLFKYLCRFHISDLGPFRAIKTSSLKQLRMQDKRFGWTVEMQLKALQCNMNVVEEPVSCMPRQGKSKISGTVKGVIGAAIGIIGTIIYLYIKPFKK